jgi:hypothetical protein
MSFLDLLFYADSGLQDESPNQRWAFFTEGIFFCDLMSVE